MSELSSSSDVAIRPAATVIVLRDGAAGLEVLLMQRASELSFHGGAWAFPGGRVDAIDRPVSLARPAARGDDDGALEVARRAAVREAHEEAQLQLGACDLVPFSHWTTPPGGPRRFATWFFLVRCADDACVVPDGKEMSAHQWLAPRKALTHKAEGQMELPAPTYVSLEQLSRFASADAALAAARGVEPFVFVPRPTLVPQGVISLYGGDAAYDDGLVEREGPRHRLCMFRQGWRYERSF